MKEQKATAGRKHSPVDFTPRQADRLKASHLGPAMLELLQIFGSVMDAEDALLQWSAPGADEASDERTREICAAFTPALDYVEKLLHERMSAHLYGLTGTEL